MANHPYNQHREQQVAHRRVATILNGSPSGAKKHMDGPAYSQITSKSAACRDDEVRGHSSPKRYARGGKVKGDTNINIVIPGGGKPPMPMPLPMGGPPPGPGLPPPPPMGGPPPPGMPMRASGGKVDGQSTKAGIAKQSARAAANSYARGGMTAGSESGVGRLQEARYAKKHK